VPVNVSIKDSPGVGYEIAEINYEPKSVTITGPAEELEGVESIDIDNLSVAGMTANYETTIDISQYLPEGITLAQDSGNVVVSVVVEKVTEKELSLTAAGITLKNTDSNYDYKVNLSSDFGLTISGLEDEVKALKLTTLAPYIDCSKLQMGENYNVELKYLEIDGVTVSVNGSIEISVSSKE
jgi:YbbR domain-containing protein